MDVGGNRATERQRLAVAAALARNQQGRADREAAEAEQQAQQDRLDAQEAERARQHQAKLDYAQWIEDEKVSRQEGRFKEVEARREAEREAARIKAEQDEKQRIADAEAAEKKGKKVRVKFSLLAPLTHLSTGQEGQEGEEVGAIEGGCSAARAVSREQIRTL